ncbi:MAG: hypothetical protein P8J55_07130, partial [Pseudomonadales bacterium]|nr:hypothetical protein [Pseudomonadales bacterium]
MSNLQDCKTIENFGEWLAEGLGRPTSKFVQDMLKGIYTSRSVRLADVARALGESCDLHATRNRLSRNLANSELATELSYRLLQQSAHSIKRDTRLIVHIHTLTKPDARKMQYLYEEAEDSASKQPPSAIDGYQVCEIIANNVGSRKYLPLLSTFWSRHAPEYVSDADKINRSIHRVLTMTNGRGIVLLDHPSVGLPTLNELIAELSSDAGVRFVARIQDDNTRFRYRQQSKMVSELAKLCNVKYASRIFKVQPTRWAPRQDVSDYQALYQEIGSSTDETLAERSIGMEYGSLTVRHHASQRRLTLIALKGELNSRLLTSLEGMRTRKSLLQPIESWFSIWETVSAHSSIREGFAPGDIGVMTYDRMQLLLTLLH